jgi:hypothetical protein
LMTSVLEELKPGFDSFRALPAGPVWVAGDLPGLRVRFSGATEWGQEENEVVVMSYRGTSVVMLAEAQAGRAVWAQDDIETMLGTLEVPR